MVGTMTRVSLLHRAVAAVFVVFLHYVPQITLYMDDGERYFGRWGLGNVARMLSALFCWPARPWASIGRFAAGRRPGRRDSSITSFSSPC